MIGGLGGTLLTLKGMISSLHYALPMANIYADINFGIQSLTNMLTECRTRLTGVARPCPNVTSDHTLG